MMFDLRKSTRIKTFGMSMYPLLHDSDICYYEKISFKQVHVNDIVLIKEQNLYFMHRVIFKTQNYIMTKGDNNLNGDTRVSKENIIAKLTSVKRKNDIFTPEHIYLVQSTYYLNEIRQLSKYLTKRGINFLFLKGLPLHLYYEKTHPKRIYSDCDILIQKKDYKKVIEIFKKINYKKVNNNLFGSKDIHPIVVEESYYKHTAHFPIIFDLHIEPVFLMTQFSESNTDLYPINLLHQMIKGFFSTKKLVKVKKDAFPILEAHHLSMYLSLHFFHHNYRDIYRLEFIYKVIMYELEKEKNKQFWNRLRRLIKKFNVESYCYPVFVMLNQYYHLAIPKEFMQSFNKNSILSDLYLKKMIIPNVFNGESRISGGIHRFVLSLLFSPAPIYKKVIILCKPSILKIGVKVLISQFKRKLPNKLL